MIFRTVVALGIFNAAYLLSFALQMTEDFRMSASAGSGVAVRRNNLAGAFLLAVWFLMKGAEAVVLIQNGAVPFFIRILDSALMCRIAARNAEQIDLRPDGASFRKILTLPKTYSWSELSAEREARGVRLSVQDGTTRLIRRTDERFDEAVAILKAVGILRN